MNRQGNIARRDVLLQKVPLCKRCKRTSPFRIFRAEVLFLKTSEIGSFAKQASSRCYSFSLNHGSVENGSIWKGTIGGTRFSLPSKKHHEIFVIYIHVGTNISYQIRNWLLFRFLSWHFPHLFKLKNINKQKRDLEFQKKRTTHKWIISMLTKKKLWNKSNFGPQKTLLKRSSFSVFFVYARLEIMRLGALMDISWDVKNHGK